MREKVRSSKIEFESTAVIKCVVERLDYNNYMLMREKCKELGQTC